MRKLPFILLLFFVCAIPFNIQGKENTPSDIITKANQLKDLLTKAESLTPEETDNSGINGLITKKLTQILTNPACVNYKLDSLFQHDYLQITHSDDNLLWVFSWSENTGGSFQSNVNVVHYRIKQNTGYKLGCKEFDGHGALYDKIYKLNASNKTNLYLALGNGRGCSSCTFYTAQVFQLTNNAFSLTYPAFQITDTDINGEDVKKNASIFQLDSRDGSVEHFDFDTKKQAIEYTYTPDDNTPIQADPDKAKAKVVGSLQFNGEKFSQKETETVFTPTPLNKSVKTKAGGLANALATLPQHAITSLTIEGTLDSRDFVVLREMESLQNLDLKNTSIVAYKGKDGSSATMTGDSVYLANHIPAYAFARDLKSIVLPQNIVAIDNSAFSCYHLKTIVIPSSVKSIGDWGFSECHNLESITIPNTVSRIGKYAFSYCASLTTIQLPATLDSINESLFSNCENLKSVVIPATVKSIGAYAFGSCSSLNSITLPANITSIGEYAFSSCFHLKSITIPSSVTGIGGSAFKDCRFLMSIDLGASISLIKSGTFENCERLNTIILESSTPPKLEDGCGIKSGITVYVPEGSKNNYMTNKDWSGLKCNFIEGKPNDSVLMHTLFNKNTAWIWIIGCLSIVGFILFLLSRWKSGRNVKMHP